MSDLRNAEKVPGNDIDVQLEQARTTDTVVTVDTFAGIDPTLNRMVTRKMDRRIIPWLFGVWLLAFIDRANIGNAKIEGLSQDLKLTGNKFNVSLAVFYVAYIAIDVPSNWVVKRLKAGHYIPGLLIGWGIVSSLLGLVRSYSGLLVARFFLGLCEGGLLGAIVIYLAMFYPRHQMLFRIGLFYCAAPLSGAFGGLLATGLSKISVGRYQGWPWIFFIEGLITVVYGCVAFFFMPHTPSHAQFLTEEEKQVALDRMKQDSHHAESGVVDEEHFDWRWVRMAFSSPNTWIVSIAWFFLLVPLYSFSLFLPTLIRDLGYTSTTAQLFTVPPNMVAFCFVLITAFASDRLKLRGPFMLGGCMLGIIGYAMLLGSHDKSVRYGATFFVATGVYVGSPMAVGWLSNNLAPHYVRATGIGFQIAFANCAAFIAVFTYIAKDAPDYILGHSINLGSLALCILTVSFGMFYCRWENRKRADGHRNGRLNAGNDAWLGHQHPKFRYTL